VSEKKYLILAEAFSHDVHYGKTLRGVMRYRRESVVAILDTQRAGESDDGVPIVGTVDEGMQHGPNTALVGVVTQGGHFPGDWQELLKSCVAHGLDLENGLHVRLHDIPGLPDLAREHGVALRDLREPPPDLSTATGENLGVDATIVLTVGSDCAIGKMTATCELDLEARKRGLRSVFVPTGQTGIAIAGWGIAVDAVVSDFLAGAAERLVVEGAKRGDLLWVEGQGAILHPIYSGVTVGLIHGSAPHLYVLCHEAGRTITEGDPTESPLPSLRELIDLHERMSLKRRPAKVVAISLNTFAESEEDARAAIAAAEEETGLPADDPVRFGAGKLLEAVLNARS
jgi:D-glutamate N-acetyltransferase